MVEALGKLAEYAQQCADYEVGKTLVRTVLLITKDAECAITARAKELQRQLSIDSAVNNQKTVQADSMSDSESASDWDLDVSLTNARDEASLASGTATSKGASDKEGSRDYKSFKDESDSGSDWDKVCSKPCLMSCYHASYCRCRSLPIARKAVAAARRVTAPSKCRMLRAARSRRQRSVPSLRE